MPDKNLNTVIINRNDTSTNWILNDPQLRCGEIGVESDTGKFKIGDGSTTWSSLPYAVDDPVITIINGTATEPTTDMVTVYKDLQAEGLTLSESLVSIPTKVYVDRASTVTKTKIVNGLGYTPYDSSNPNEYISGISSSDVVSALGYTPYSSDNPSAYITNSALTNYATKSDVSNSINSLIGGAPDGLNTLSELASALNNDANFATTVADQINEKYTKPDTGIPDSDLEEDYLSSADLSDYATKTYVTSQGYVNINTETLKNYYTKTIIDDMLGTTIEIVLVDSLSSVTHPESHTIYLVDNHNDSCDQYMYLDNTWQKIGTTSVDLSAYAKIENLAVSAFSGSYADLTHAPGGVSFFINDAGYLTEHQSLTDYYTKSEVDAALDTVSGLSGEQLAQIQDLLDNGLSDLSSKANKTDVYTKTESDAKYYLASNPNGYTSNIGTLTVIKLNGSRLFDTNGVVELNNILTTTGVAADSNLLNGQPSSYYSTVQQVNTKVSIAGDTMTGQLSVPNLVTTNQSTSSSPALLLTTNNGSTVKFWAEN